MHTQFRHIFILVLFCCFSFLHGQEICDNGIDDDGDNLIDCYDPDCSNNATACGDFFIKTTSFNTTCRLTPVSGSTYTLQKLWTSDVTIDTRNTSITGDIDGDGIPEVFSHNSGANQLFILDGLTGVARPPITCPSISGFNDGVAIGDIDGDGDAEIFIVTGDNFLRSFDNLGNQLWVSSVVVGTGALVNINYRRPNLANFNGDNFVEVYVGNKIFNAHNGLLIAQGSGASIGGVGLGEAHPVAADVLPDSYCSDCDGLELICGNQVYGVDIPGNAMTLRASITGPGFKDGFTSVADFDGDDSLDIIVKAADFNVYVWNPRTQAQIGITYTLAGNGDGGQANVGNYDADPQLEIGVAGETSYVLIDNDMTTKWKYKIDDESNITSSTAFDFDCDGKYEIVYRDMDTLYIFDGATGNVLAHAPCPSQTRTEMPVIVDVDADGQANIVCTCAINAGTPTPGHVVAWKSATNNWPSTRKVFNQHNYFAVNINDDLTIPRVQQNHAAPALPNRLNSFLNQMPFMDALGSPLCYTNLADAVISIDTIIGSLCYDSITVRAIICNHSDQLLPPNMPVSFYNGDPLINGPFIQKDLTDKIIYPNTCDTFIYKVKTVAALNNLYAYVNDKGTSALNAPEVKYLECDSTNNFDTKLVITTPTVVVSPDVSICKSDNTTLTAFVSGFQNATYLWSTGETTASITISPQSTLTYSLIVSSNHCSGTDSVTATVYLIEADFVPTPATGIPPLTVDFNDQSINAIVYSWQFGDDVDPVSSLENPSHLYKQQGDFVVKLIVTDDHGCKDSTTKTIQLIEPITLFYPNTFTPDGDGVNDVFSLLSFNVTELNVIMFDRWGNRIYSWNTLNGGWNGTVKGALAQEDVYVFLVNYTTRDNEHKNFTGKVNLIR